MSGERPELVAHLGDSRYRASKSLYHLAIHEPSRLVVGGNFYASYAWDADTGARRAQMPGSRRACLSPDGRRMAFVYNGAYSFDTRTGERSVELEEGDRYHSGSIHHLAVSADETRLATASEYGFVQVWDLSERRAHGKIEPNGALRAAAFGEDRELVLVTEDRKILRCDVASPRTKVRERAYEGTPAGIVGSPDGRELVIAEEDGSLRTLDARDPRQRARGPRRRLVRAGQPGPHGALGPCAALARGAAAGARRPGLAAALVGSAISARATLDRAGGAFVLLLRLDHVPRAAAVARWAREIGERANSPVPAA